MISQADSPTPNAASPATARQTAVTKEQQIAHGLAAVIRVTDQLLLCQDEDTLLRRAVELAREELGVERFGIFLDLPGTDEMKGTYGTDMQGQTTSEGHLRLSRVETSTDTSALATNEPCHWISLDKESRSSQEAAPSPQEWVTITPIVSASGRLGVAFQDAAISNLPLDETLLNIVTIYCSMLGNMIETKRASQAMRESQRLIATLMSNLPGMAYRCRNNRDWSMEFVSEGALEVTGYRPEALIDNREVDFGELIHPDDRQGVWEQVQTALAARKPFHLTYRITTAHNEQKWLSEKGTGVFSDHGELIALEGFISDITEHKQAEEALQGAKNALEAHVHDRTLELAQANEKLRVENVERQMAMSALHAVADALRVAKEEAERANNAKSEFLSRTSHELRTPLNAILGFGQVLEMAGLPPKKQEAVSYIIKAGRHLLGLINEVLDIARVEAGHLDLSLEPVAMDEMVAECCALLRPLATERKIRLEKSDTLVGQTMVADQQRIKQVLLNLLVNAIKYNYEAGQVLISWHRVSEERGCISIRDTGPGLSREDLGKLFNPFERLGAVDTTIEGSGLGLVLSRRLMEAMGGRLQVESELGNGCVFSIELPHATASPTKAKNRGKDGIEAASTSPQLHEKMKKVLVIEDNLSNLRLLEVILDSRPQVNLLAAMQGSVGLDLARQHRPHLILLDLNLPDISGKDVLSRLKESPLTRHIPILIISADATTQQVERLLALGAKQYLTKPLDVNEFLKALDENLSALN